MLLEVLIRVGEGRKALRGMRAQNVALTRDMRNRQTRDRERVQESDESERKVIQTRVNLL